MDLYRLARRRSGATPPSRPPAAPDQDRWDALQVRRLREHLGLTQREFAGEMNARQQTVSEWETARYQPRGPSARLLSLIAERAGFAYTAPAPNQPASSDRPPPG